jgi:hypothetical protein
MNRKLSDLDQDSIEVWLLRTMGLKPSRHLRGMSAEVGEGAVDDQDGRGHPSKLNELRHIYHKVRERPQ